MACCKASEVFKRAANPAVPSECPITVFILPTSSLESCISSGDLLLCAKKVLLMASASVLSPAFVPVPWHSKYWHRSVGLLTSRPALV